MQFSIFYWLKWKTFSEMLQLPSQVFRKTKISVLTKTVYWWDYNVKLNAKWGTDKNFILSLIRLVFLGYQYIFNVIFLNTIWKKNKEKQTQHFIIQTNRQWNKKDLQLSMSRNTVSLQQQPKNHAWWVIQIWN